MPLKLHNTLSGQLETFEPLTPGRVTFYACGPTVYDHAHVGHARASVAFDILVRHLQRAGLTVDYVRNYTDVDDKIIKRAAETGRNWRDLAQIHIDSFNEDMVALKCLIPTHTPRATEYIEKMIEDIANIVARNLAYETSGDVYFDVQAFQGYGRLSHRELEEQEAGARVAVNKRKKSPGDFALWKAAKPGEPSWPSPWGPGRPGWHIECSTMSFNLLGPEFDIHGGGQDLIFPHHENELAQSAALGRPLARFWTHNGFVRLNNEKMSKSLGNFFTVKEILKKFDGETLRFFLVSKHYRGPLDFSDEALAEAEKALERIYRALAAAEEILDKSDLIFKMDLAQAYLDKFNEALDDDLNIARALGVVFNTVRALNKASASGNSADTAAYYAALKIMGEELALWQREPGEFFSSLGTRDGNKLSSEVIEELITVRAAARTAKNWTEADRLRNELMAKGVILEDKAGTTTWKYSA
ncbi:MAG: cysteine--tRNA ligase [Candidatus Adiutrix intracellularis]|jgi:cysteinyl-tRNA synthetase|nr:MAG: cysteine--tRNA ligase [Candidatus Adiutrix intracellularis]MDR2827365.1 cysteine--tRNA ligase [Candidatus Adiutrix intracellularis]